VFIFLSRLCLFFSIFIVACSASAVKASEEKHSSELQPNRVLRAIYLPNGPSRNLSTIERHVQEGKPHGLNMFVLDAQTYNGHRTLINPEVIRYLRQENMYIAIRVVCFLYGLKTLPTQRQLDTLYTIIEESAKSGADEVQLDYIRFEDESSGISIDRKKAVIEGILERARSIVDAHNVKLSADIFGRIPYNRRDRIGQNIEGFARHVHVLKPMLYPSHFTADRKRLSEPGFTIREGTQLTLDRVQGTGVTVQPWIQVFRYNIGWARVSYVRYIELQIEGAEETEARGWVAWNAHGHYAELWQALANIEQRRREASQNNI
jgi:hypothetical protein